MNDYFHNDIFFSAFQPFKNSVYANGCNSLFPMVFANPVSKVVIGMQGLQFITKAEKANELVCAGVVYGPKIKLGRPRFSLYLEEHI